MLSEESGLPSVSLDQASQPDDNCSILSHALPVDDDSVMLPDIDAVTASYHRCRASGDFVDTFYQRFLAKSPEVAAKFKNTDFTRQKLMLRESLLMMLLFNMRTPQSSDELERLGERHSRRGVDIQAPLYDLWLDALCETIEQHDPEYTPELGEKWRTAMQPGIELLLSKY